MTWRRLKHDIHAERTLLAHCRAAAVNCSPGMQSFLAIIAKGAASTGRIRIGLINRAVNLAIRPVNNSTPREVRDHWNDPITTLMAGRGDCKDYAIVKYAALIEAGIAERDLRVVILRDLSASEDHAVVAVRLDGAWVVLDNRWLALVGDVNIRRVIPLFRTRRGRRRTQQSTKPRASICAISIVTRVAFEVRTDRKLSNQSDCWPRRSINGLSAVNASTCPANWPSKTPYVCLSMCSRYVAEAIAVIDVSRRRRRRRRRLIARRRIITNSRDLRI